MESCGIDSGNCKAKKCVELADDTSIYTTTSSRNLSCMSIFLHCSKKAEMISEILHPSLFRNESSLLYVNSKDPQAENMGLVNHNNARAMAFLLT